MIDTPTVATDEILPTQAEPEQDFALLDVSHFPNAPTTSPVHVSRREKIGEEWENWTAMTEEQRERILWVMLATSNMNYTTKRVFKHFLHEVMEWMNTEEPFPEGKQTTTELMVDLSNIPEYAKKAFIAVAPAVCQTGSFGCKTQRGREAELHESLDESEMEERAKVAFRSAIKEAAERFGAPESTELKKAPHLPESFLVYELEKLPLFYQNIFRNVLDEARDFLGNSSDTTVYVGMAAQNTPGPEDEDGEDYESASRSKPGDASKCRCPSYNWGEDFGFHTI